MKLSWRLATLFLPSQIVVLDLPAVKAEMLQGLNDSNYAGHVEIQRTVYNVKRID